MFLSILLLAANLLPALHAHEPFTSQNSEKEFNVSKISENYSRPAVDCDLCDFHFSSTNGPIPFSYDFPIPATHKERDFSIAETIYLFPLTQFALRAPPVTKA